VQSRRRLSEVPFPESLPSGRIGGIAGAKGSKKAQPPRGKATIRKVVKRTSAKARGAAKTATSAVKNAAKKTARKVTGRKKK